MNVSVAKSPVGAYMSEPNSGPREVTHTEFEICTILCRRQGRETSLVSSKLMVIRGSVIARGKLLR